MQITNRLISSGCNTVYHAAAWHKKHPVIAYASGHQVNIYSPDTNKVTLNLIGHTKRVNVPKFLLLQKEITLISGGSDGTLCIWKANGDPFVHTSWRQDFKTQLDESICNIVILELSETETYIVTLTTSTQVTLWKYDGTTLHQLDLLHFGTTFQEACGLELVENRYLFVFLGGIDKLVHIYSYDIKSTEKATLQYHVSLKGHENAITDYAIAKIKEGDEEFFFLASSSRDTYIRLWRFSKYNEEKDQLKAFQNKNNHKITISQGNLYILSLESILSGHSDHVSSVTWGLVNPKGDPFSESNLCLLSTSFDFSCYIWTNDKKDDLWVNRVRLGQLGGNKNAFFGATYNEDYTKILANTFSGAFHLWHIKGEYQYDLVPTITGHFNHVTDLDWSSEGDYLVSCSSDQTTRVYGEWKKTGTWHEISRAQVHGYDLNAIRNLRVPSKDGKKFADYLVSGGDEKVIRMFEPSLAFINNLNSLSDKNLRLYFENPAEEEKLLDKSSERVRYIINMEATSQVLGLMTKVVQVEQPQITTYGKGEDGEDDLQEEDEKEAIEHDYNTPPVESYLINRTLWPEMNKLYGHGYELKAIAINSTGTIIASACKSQTADHACIILWDPKKYNIIDKIFFHNYTAVALEFSKDDQYLVSVSRDRQIGLFKLDANDSQHPYKQVWGDKSHARIVWTVSFSHDTKYFITGARDKMIKLWQLSDKPTKVCDKVFSQPVVSVAFSTQAVGENRYLFAVGLENGELHLCDFNASTNTIGQLGTVPKFLGHALAVNKLQFRPNTKEGVLTLATASEDHSVKIFDIQLEGSS